MVVLSAFLINRRLQYSSLTNRLPGVRHSFQVTPSVALSSSSMEALISAISWMISGLSGDLHLMWARDSMAFS